MIDPHQSWGVVALGVSGNVSAELLSSVAGEETWLLQLTGRGWEFSVSIDRPGSIETFADFVEHYCDQAEYAEHRVGSFHSAEVVYVKDSEHADRFWLRARGFGQLIEVAIRDHEATEFRKAIRTLVEEINERKAAEPGATDNLGNA